MPISLPAQKNRTMYEAVKQILAAVSAATGQRIFLGTSPVNYLMNARMEEGANDMAAREILLRAFQTTGGGVSWELLYAPSEQFYGFNVHGVKSKP